MIDFNNIQSIKDYLESLVKLQKLNDRLPKEKYISIFDFILQNGQECFPQEFNFELYPHVPRTKRECFRNAYHLAEMHDLIYVEGIANDIIPVQHAWCVDINCNVIDPTWDHPETCSYFGVLFDLSFVSKTIFKRRMFGVIDNVEHRFPLLTGKHLDFKYKINKNESGKI
jgi:hypothetical protein